jgi:indolepyruvate ferredoxin oxidoreductase
MGWRGQTGTHEVPIRKPARLSRSVLALPVESGDEPGVEANQAAFEWGRRWVTDPAAVDALIAFRSEDVAVVAPPLPAPLDRRVARIPVTGADEAHLRLMCADLVAYQDRRYAGRWLELVERVAAAEAGVGGTGDLTSAVATSYHKLLAYKDEYEVARLMLGDDGLAPARAVGGERPRITRHLHPPALSALGVDRKVRFGPATRPAFAALARARWLRGRRLDPFGRTEVRTLERRLPVEYAAAVDAVLGRLTAAGLPAAAELARLPDCIRGYEVLKLRRAAAYRTELAERLATIVGS